MPLSFIHDKKQYSGHRHPTGRMDFQHGAWLQTAEKPTSFLQMTEKAVGYGGFGGGCSALGCGAATAFSKLHITPAKHSANLARNLAAAVTRSNYQATVTATENAMKARCRG